MYKRKRILFKKIHIIKPFFFLFHGLVPNYEMKVYLCVVIMLPNDTHERRNQNGWKSFSCSQIILFFIFSFNFFCVEKMNVPAKMGTERNVKNNNNNGIACACACLRSMFNNTIQGHAQNFALRSIKTGDDERSNAIE